MMISMLFSKDASEDSVKMVMDDGGNGGYGQRQPLFAPPSFPPPRRPLKRLVEVFDA